jgi:hypothetical protein
MVHGFRSQRDSRHLPKGGAEILARKLPMQFAARQAPAFNVIQFFLYFSVAKFFARHFDSPIGATARPFANNDYLSVALGLARNCRN